MFILSRLKEDCGYPQRWTYRSSCCCQERFRLFI